MIEPYFSQKKTNARTINKAIWSPHVIITGKKNIQVASISQKVLADSGCMSHANMQITQASWNMVEVEPCYIFHQGVEINKQFNNTR